MTEAFTKEVREELEKKYGKILGKKNKNSKLFKHTGNWAYRSSMFFCTNIKNAVATAINIDASLMQYNEETKEWDLVFDIEDLYESGNPEVAECIEYNLENLGYDRSIFRGGKPGHSYYQGLTREDIPEGAVEIAPGFFI